MGGLCSPNLATSLLAKYEQPTILGYVQSFVGQQLIGSQFSGLTNQVTQLLNTNPQTKGNTGLLNNIIQSISAVQARQTSKVVSQRPSIPELDNLSPQKRDGILSSFQNQFSGQLNSYKAGLMNQLAPSLNPATYLNQFVGGAGQTLTNQLGGFTGQVRQPSVGIPSGGITVSPPPTNPGVNISYGSRY